MARAVRGVAAVAALGASEQQHAATIHSHSSLGVQVSVKIARLTRNI